MAGSISGGCFVIINTLLGYKASTLFYIMSVLLVIVLTVGSRLTYRAIRRMLSFMSINSKKEASKVLIIGAGSAGKLIIKEIFLEMMLQK